jgi:hypothetical protein
MISQSGRKKGRKKGDGPVSVPIINSYAGSTKFLKSATPQKGKKVIHNRAKVRP